jgi:DivIVA domain-containing protein
MPRLTAEEIHRKEFKRSMRGYDISDVNEFLNEIIKDYLEFEQREQLTDRSEFFNYMEELMEQLLYEVQQLKEENRLLREQLAALTTNPTYPPPPYYR